LNKHRLSVWHSSGEKTRDRHGSHTGVCGGRRCFFLMQRMGKELS
jgi:hypothetical protein